MNQNHGIIAGPKSPMIEVMQSCRRIAPSESTVLITGETGTGKEVFARYVHDQSRRAGKPFVPVNCGAIPETLLESELFGHVRGAFTGANANRKGRVAMADGGTLFLDEIGELSLALQVKLLRLLQAKTYEPVGSAESVSANFRLVAATNRNLAEEVEAGRFRRDLYYRLMVCPVVLPPLRARTSDVRVLFTHFWLGRGEKRVVHEDVLRAMENHAWPGNVRELENLVERLSVCVDAPSLTMASLPVDLKAVLSGVGSVEASFAFSADVSVNDEIAINPMETIGAALLPMTMINPMQPEVTPNMAIAPEARLTQPIVIDQPAAKAEGIDLSMPIDLPAMLKALEDAYIDAALKKADGNRKSAADLLGLQRTTLVEKLRRRTRDQQPVASIENAAAAA